MLSPNYELEAALRAPGDLPSVRALEVLADGRLLLNVFDQRLVDGNAAPDEIWVLDRDEGRVKLSDHAGGITFLKAISGNRVLAGTHDGALKLWDEAQGRCTHAMTGTHTEHITCIEELPGGMIVTASMDATLKCWSDGHCVRTLVGHSGWVTCVAALPGVGRVVSGSHDGTVRCWDVADGRCLAVLSEGLEGWVNAVAVLSEGRLATGSDDSSIKIFSLAEGRCLRTLTGPDDTNDDGGSDISCIVALSNTRICVGSWDCTVTIWDVDTGRCLQTLTTERQCSIKSVKILPHDRILSVDSSGNLAVWADALREQEKSTAKQVASQRACDDVDKHIAKFI